MRKIIIAFMSLFFLSSANASPISCPINSTYNNKSYKLNSVQLVSNGYNNYLKCSYGNNSFYSDAILPTLKQMYEPTNVMNWERTFSSLIHECASFRNIKRPISEQMLQSLTQQCSVIECPRKGGCIL